MAWDSMLSRMKHSIIAKSEGYASDWHAHVDYSLPNVTSCAPMTQRKKGKEK